MELTVTIKNHYGTEHIYPACEKSKLFARLANTKTLRSCDIETIKELGYTFTVQTPKI